MVTFICNDQAVAADCGPGLAALEWIRYHHGLTGTKAGCREGDCGACTVLVGRPEEGRVRYQAVCSCLLPLGELQGRHLVTIEGLCSKKGLTPIQQAFYDQGASQCGFCTPGMVMSLTGCLLSSKRPGVKEAMASLDGNICRCTGYLSIRRAVQTVFRSLPEDRPSRLEMLIAEGHVPRWFREIPDRLRNLAGVGPNGEGPVVAGGTDLYVSQADRLSEISPKLLLREGMDEISVEGGLVRIGAGVTVADMLDSPELSELLEPVAGYLEHISSTQIRNRATVGGNIVNASPIADLAVLFLALGAILELDGRDVPLEGFYRGYKEVDLQQGELLRRLSFPMPQGSASLSAIKVSKRRRLDIASVNSAALIRMEGDSVASATIAAGGVYPYPLLLKRTGGWLAGRKLTRETALLAEEAAAGEIAPISDIRGSAEYKERLLRAQIRAHLLEGGKM